MNYRILIFSWNYLKIVIIGAVICGIFQLICWKYLKNHPELLNTESSKNIKDPSLNQVLPRGGAFIEVSVAKIVLNFIRVLVYIASKGTIAGIMMALSAVIIRKIPTAQISTVLSNALITTH